jgi:transcriptional regulator with XRE-family HTH domain
MVRESSIMERIESLLNKRGISHYQLGQAVGAKDNTVSNWFNRPNACPRPEYLVKIAKFLNVSMEYLVTGEDAPTLQSDVILLCEHIQNYLANHPGERDRLFAVIHSLTAEQPRGASAAKTQRGGRKTA